MQVQGNGTGLGFPERIHRKPCVGFYGEIIHFVAKEDVVAGGIPCNIVPQLSFDSCVDEGRIPDRVRRSGKEGRVEVIP